MGHTVAIHQPNYLPWIGYFQKIHESDTFVFLDSVEYSSGSWFNRNRIKTNHGWMWLTVPLHANNGDLIADATIDHSQYWRKNHRKSLDIHYVNADHADALDGFIDDAYGRRWDLLCDRNRHMIRELSALLGLETAFVRATDLDVSGRNSRLLVDICEATGATRYLAGQGGSQEYLDESLFDDRGIEVAYQAFDFPEYPQWGDEFIPNLSIVDMILNLGPSATADHVRTLGRPEGPPHPLPDGGS